MRTYDIFLPGIPVPKERPRGRIRNGKVQIYTPDKTEFWERTIVVYMLRGVGRIDLDSRVCINMTFYLVRPKSVKRSKVEFPDHSKEDVDNLAKAVMDAMQRAGALRNDARVTDLYVAKRYADDCEPGVRLTFTG